MIREAIVLAGGFGTRLRSVVADLPKPMAPVNGKPFLHYVLLRLQQSGIRRVILSVGYLHEKIQSHFGAEYLGMQISYAIEKEPLGTGGGIRLAMGQCTDAHVLVVNGDTLFAIPYPDFFEQHLGSSADVSLALRRIEDGARYGTIELNGKRIIAFREKSPDHSGVQLINGGIYAIRRKSFMHSTEASKNFSIETDFFALQTEHLQLQGFVYENYFIDIGVPEDYQQAQEEFARYS